MCFLTISPLDPITGDDFELRHPHHPFIISPDGETTICYNESTLRRIAQTKGKNRPFLFIFIFVLFLQNNKINSIDNFNLIQGKWMQPPHFREVMTDELRKKCEKIGGSSCSLSTTQK